MTSYLNNQAGVTVRNLLRGLSLMGVLLGVALYFTARPEHPRPSAPLAGETRPEVRHALELLAGELRALNQSATTKAPAAALLGAGPAYLRFQLSPAAEESDQALVPAVTYVFSAGNLVRNDGGFARVLCGGLDLLEFSYLLDDGRRLGRPEASELSRIQGIELTLIAPFDAPMESAAAARRSFRLPSGASFTPPADGRPRRQFSTRVQLRPVP